MISTQMHVIHSNKTYFNDQHVIKEYYIYIFKLVINLYNQSPDRLY